MAGDHRGSPAVVAYLRSLPDGIRSYPDCTVHREIYDGVVTRLDTSLEGAPWPSDLAGLRPSHDSGPWFPEVHMQAMSLILAAQIGDEPYMQWVYEDSARIFQRPVFRHLMKLVSPTLMVMGATSRWGAMHRGTTLKATPVKRDGERMATVGTLETPPELFTHVYARALCMGFKAALDGARATDVRVELVELEATKMDFKVSWAR